MIRFDAVVKEFGGRLRKPVRALDGISLELGPGTALGIAGPNGAGKSTLLRLLLGYLRATRGEVTIGGLPPREYVERHGIAYVSETIAIPPSWTVMDALRAFAALGEVEGERKRIGEVMERLGVGPLADRKVAALSKGNLQRLALAQALLAPRKVMILDEPSHGLDPEWTVRLRGLVAEWRIDDPERVLLIASHNLDEMEHTVERVAVLRDGRLCALLEAHVPDALVLEVDGMTAATVAAAYPGAVPAAGEPGAYLIPRGEAAQLSAQLRQALADGAVLRALAPRPTTLEQRVRAALLRPGSEGS
jgi:ABC-type multidrug transport system ATPase subunit